VTDAVYSLGVLVGMSLALTACSPAAPAEPASRPLRLCFDAAPSAYAQARAEAAAGAWGCVTVAEHNCDARVAWSSAPVVTANGAPGLAPIHKPRRSLVYEQLRF